MCLARAARNGASEGEGRRGERERFSKKKKKKGRGFRERGNGPWRRADCLSAHPRCPGCPAPAAVKNSHKMAARPGPARRLRKGEVGGGTGRRRRCHVDERGRDGPKARGKNRREAEKAEES